jgi:hypothetical protein
MKTVEIKILKIARRTLRIIRHLFPPSGLSGDRVIDRAYWAVVHRHDELARRKREARRLLRSRRVDGTGTVR